MKAQRTFAHRACLFGIGILLLVGRPNGAQAACFFVGAIPDGRILGPYFLSSTSNDISFAFGVETGRSYSVEAFTSQGSSGGGAPFLTGNIDVTFCPTTDIVSPGVTVRNTNNITPDLLTFAAPGIHVRNSVVVTSFPVGGFLEMRVHNAAADPSGIVVSVSETTLFSPGWTTIGPNDTFYSFQNTTNATINGTLILFNAAGIQISATTFAILTKQTAFTGTPSLGTPRGQSGTARFIHDGPLGAILAEAAVANFTTAPASIQTVQFKPVRERR